MPERVKGAHFGIDSRTHIEQGILRKDSMSKIAKDLGVSTSSVIREVKRNRVPESPRYLVVKSRNICMRADICKKAGLCGNGCLIPCRRCKSSLCNDLCPDFLPKPCPLLEKAPYCCNDCSNRYGFGCSHPYLFYDAHMANELANKRKSESRQGIDCTEEELEHINYVVTPLVLNGQSPEVVWSSHGHELPITPRTYRNYVQMGAVDIINLQLPEWHLYKPRKKKQGPKEDSPSLVGHLYEDFMALPEEKRAKAVQMDCVEGKQGELPAILTLTFPAMEFQILVYLEVENQTYVKKAFDDLQFLLGDAFEDLFEIVLTDRGEAFKGHAKLEYGKNGMKRCSVYYCDPQRSDQKAGCERNHRELRRIIPKGTSLLKFERGDMPLIASHLNSYPRPNLNFLAPLRLAEKNGLGDLIFGLGYELLNPDDVVMKPSLIKHILAR